MDNNTVLTVENVNKRFPGVQALSNFSLTLRKGEVHAIVGENGAGKSTLMNIISGNLRPDSGKIIVDGKEVSFDSSRDAQMCGISIVHQELANCPAATVAENVFMSKIGEQRRLFMNYKKMYRDTAKLLEVFQSNINPRTKMKQLKISDQQIVEIVKALSANCKIIIFDEPTAAITEQETELLFKIISDLKAKGISILYISHRMEEIFRNCDRVTVLKDGCFVDTLNVKDTEKTTIISKMVGRELGDIYPKKGEVTDDIIFEVEGLCSKHVFNNISFKLNKGEILGISGLIGSGRSEIARTAVGLDKRDTGSIKLYGETLKIHNYKDAIDNGIVYLTEDRKEEGLMLNLSIVKNISALDLGLVGKGLTINSRKEAKQAKKLCEEINVRCTSIQQKVGTLSGGNQQKVLISKLLTIRPKVIIMDEPTRGIDVGAKVEIHKMLRDLAKQGIGIIIISSELPEVIGMSDKVIVVHNGEITAELVKDDISENTIMHKASGY